MDDYSDHHLDYLMDERLSAGLFTIYLVVLLGPVLLLVVVILAVLGVL